MENILKYFPIVQNWKFQGGIFTTRDANESRLVEPVSLDFLESFLTESVSEMAKFEEYRQPVLCLFEEHLIALAGIALVWWLLPRRLSQSSWSLFTWGSNVQTMSVGGVVAGGKALAVQGAGLRSNLTKKPAAQLRLVAVDEEGEELENVELDLEQQLNLSVDAGEGRIDSVEMIAGGLKIVRAGEIGSVRNTNGRIVVEKCGNVKSIQTTNGAVEVGECLTIHRTQTVNGGINVRHEKSPRRR